MKVVVISNDALKEELMATGLQEGVEVLWFTTIHFPEEATICIDLLFDNSPGRLDQLRQLPAELVLVNSLIIPGNQLPANFIAFNGWKSFLKRNIVEAAAAHTELREKAEKTFSYFHKTIEWVPDQPGFISARVVSMIINEAYLALEEGVSTRAAIDTAMQLGTNYPHGPFAWSQLIGLKNITDLLFKLAETNTRYQPSALLQQEAAIS